MSSAVFPKAKERALGAGLDLVNLDIRVMLVLSTYTYDAADEFVADLGAVDNGRSAAFGTVALQGSIAPAGVAAASAVGVPALNGTIAPAGIASIEAFGSPRVAILRVVGIASAEAFGVPALAASPTSQPGSIGGFDGSPVRRKAPYVIRPVGIASEEEIGRPTVMAATKVISRVRSRAAREREFFMLETERLAA